MSYRPMCLASCTNGVHDTHPWHDALDSIARHGGGLYDTPTLTGSLATARIQFGSIVAAADWIARNRVASDVRIDSHSDTFDRPVSVRFEWLSLA